MLFGFMEVDEARDIPFDPSKSFFEQMEREYFAQLDREIDADIQRKWYEHIGFDPISMGM